MAKVTRTDFARKNGVSLSTLRVYINRGKVVASGPKFIDELLPENIAFAKDRARKMSDPNFVAPPVSKRKSKLPSKKKEVKKHTAKPEIDPNEDDTPPNFDPLVRSLDDLRAGKLEVETRILSIKESKMLGEIVPVDLIKPVFIQFSKSMTTAFQNEIENILVEIGHKAKLSRDEKAELRGRMRTLINQAVQDGVEDSKKNIIHIATDFSELRGRGESK